MTHVQQPKDSRLCGQTCVAIIANVSLDRAIAACAHGRRATSERQLRAGLGALGFRLGSFEWWREQRVDGILLMRVRYAWRKNGYHWIARRGQIVYDPSLPEPMSAGRYRVRLRARQGYLTRAAQVEPTGGP